MSESLKLKVLFDGIDKLSGPLKRMMQGSSGLAKAVKATRDELKGFEAQQRKLAVLQKTTDDLADNTAELKKQGQALRDLRAKIAATDEPSKNLRKQQREQLRIVKELASRNDRLKESHIQVRREVQAAGVPLKQLSHYQEQLRTNIARTNTQIEAQSGRLVRLRNAQRSYTNIMNARGRVAGTGAGLMATGAAAGAAFMTPVRAFAQAEAAATDFQAALMLRDGSVSPEYQRILALTEKLGDRLPGTTADFHKMMTMLIRQGIPAKSLLEGMGEATALLAVQLKMAPDQAAEFAAKLQDATRTANKDMLPLMDTIQRTFYLGVDQNNMLDAFAKMAPALDVLRKKGIEASRELAPLIVMADQAGLEGGPSGNAFRKIFQAAVMRSRSGDGAGAFGLEFTNGKGEFAGLTNMFAQLDKLKRLTTEKRLGVLKNIFGDDAETLQALNIMIDKGLDGYLDVQKRMEDQADLQKRVNKQLDTLAALWDAASGTFMNALSAIGNAIKPELKALIQWIGDVSAGLREWAKENPQMASWMMKITALVAGGAIAFGGLALAVSALMGPFAILRLVLGLVGAKSLGVTAVLKGTFSGLGRVFGWLTGAFKFVGKGLIWLGRLATLHPIGRMVALLASGAILIWENWDKIQPVLTSVWESIGASFRKYLYDPIMAAIKKIQEIRALVAGKIQGAWDWAFGEDTPAMAGAGGGGSNTVAPLRSRYHSKTVNQQQYHFTINGAPGQSEAEIGRIVQQTIQDEHRKAGRARRSRYGDVE